MFERYAPGILDIIFSGADAKQSVEKCENVKDDELSSLLEQLWEGTEDKDIDSLIARLEISEDGSDSDSGDDSREDANTEETNSEEVDEGVSGKMKIRTDLFETEGGAD